MTCIVGLIDGKKVWMGGDSAGVDPDALSIATCKMPKVFKVGKFVIGFSVSFRMGQLLQYKLKPPKHPPDMDTYEYMVKHFVEAVRRCFGDGGLGNNGDDNNSSGGNFLVGYQGRLFLVLADYTVFESSEPYAATGCGGEYAVGALHGASGRSTPEARILKALKAAEHHSAGVRGPFTVVST